MFRLTPPWQGWLDRRRAEEARREEERKRRERRDLKFLGIGMAVLAVIITIGALTEDEEPETGQPVAGAVGASSATPVSSAAATTSPVRVPSRMPSATTAATPKPVYYASCAAVSAAPLARTAPGYRAALDLDQDGRACELNGDDAPKPATTKPTTTKPTTTKPRPATPPLAEDGGADPRFPTCKKAKAAGYGPYFRGVDPEYSWYRDADKDGTVCE